MNLGCGVQWLEAWGQISSCLVFGHGTSLSFSFPIYVVGVLTVWDSVTHTVMFRTTQLTAPWMKNDCHYSLS